MTKTPVGPVTTVTKTRDQRRDLRRWRNLRTRDGGDVARHDHHARGSKSVTTAVNSPSVKGTVRNADAFFAKLEIGNLAAKGDVNFAFQRGYIEPNAVLSLYSDSDSGIGYDNQKWYKADIGYMLANGLQVNLGQYVVKRVDYDILGNTVSNTMEKSSRAPMFRTQFDFVVKL